jgi:hypothetical protein
LPFFRNSRSRSVGLVMTGGDGPVIRPLSRRRQGCRPVGCSAASR